MFYDVILASLVIHLYKQIILIFFFIFIKEQSFFQTRFSVIAIWIRMYLWLSLAYEHQSFLLDTQSNGQSVGG